MRALKHHGGDPDGGIDAIERGAENLRRHLGIVSEFGPSTVVASTGSPATRTRRSSSSGGSPSRHGASAAELNEGFEHGGEGAQALAEAVVAAAESPSEFKPLYELDEPIEAKIEAICKRVYGADGVDFLPAARDSIARAVKTGFDKLPICMAKTHLSLSHDPALTNAPTGFTVTVRDVRAYTGAGWLVALCGDMQTMPGYGVSPAAFNVDIDETGKTIGLF